MHLLKNNLQSDQISQKIVWKKFIAIVNEVRQKMGYMHIYSPITLIISRQLNAKSMFCDFLQIW